MKAIIMAGGEGARLRPLTCDCPKPMVRLMDKPVMEYALMLLRRHGISEAAVTLGYLPDAIVDYFGDGDDFGIRLRYYTEKTPLGTAGGVKQAEDFLTETFCVLSGDGLTDLDLTQALAFHRARGAQATLLLKRCANPLEYGVVVTAPDGRVRNFVEKPGPGEVISDAINTGVYILEPEVLSRIPANAPCDFGSELFPRMVEAGEKVYGCLPEGYWCDIGDVRAYLQAHADVMDGKFSLGDALFYEKRAVVSPDALVDAEATIEAPCYIASGARVYAGAHVGAYSVLGAGCQVARRADVKRTVLWKGASVREDAQTRGCVLARDSAVMERAQAFEEGVLGTGAVLGARATLMPGAKVWPFKRVMDGERLSENLVWGSLCERGFSDGTLPLTDPAQAARAGRATVETLHPKEILVAHTPSAVSAALFHAYLSGLMAQGTQVVEAGIATLPELRHALWLHRSDAAALVGSDGVTVLNGRGAVLTRKRQRAMTTLLLRQDYSGPFTGITRPPVNSGRTELTYVAWLAGRFAAPAKEAPGVAVFAEDTRLLSIAEKAFSRAGLRVRCEWEEEMMELSDGEVGVWLGQSGESASFYGQDGPLTEAENQMLLAWTALEMGEKALYLGVGATRGIEKLVEAYAAEAHFASVERAKWADALSDASREQFDLNFDGLAFAMSAISELVSNGLTLDGWRAKMPRVHRVRRDVELREADRARCLRVFSQDETDAELGGGIRIQRDDGWALITPDESQPRVSIVSESARAEFADELCAFCEKRLAQLLGGGEENIHAQK